MTPARARHVGPPVADIVERNRVRRRRKHSRAGDQVLGRDTGQIARIGFCSAPVTYPVASTNLANFALVTGVASIQNPSMVTEWTGKASGIPQSAQPIWKVPPGIQTAPSEVRGFVQPASAKIPRITSPPVTSTINLDMILKWPVPSAHRAEVIESEYRRGVGLAVGRQPSKLI